LLIGSASIAVVDDVLELCRNSQRSEVNCSRLQVQWQP